MADVVHQWRTDSTGRFWCPCGGWEDHAPPNEAMSLRFIAHIDEPDQRAAFQATHDSFYGRRS